MTPWVRMTMREGTDVASNTTYSLTCEGCGKTESSTKRLSHGWLSISNHGLSETFGPKFVYAEVCSVACLIPFAQKHSAK